jgi:LmbE family N-acetylglucosaminyl deacetylase
MSTRLWILSLVLLAALSGSRAGNRNTYPLPEERGTAGILASLEKLPVYVRVLQITAHPDDESAGTLTWLSRKFHAHTALFCLTRGEGGQNILGNEKYEELGLVRTGELLEACRYYGADLYFGTVLDFGFSKTAEETLSKWGHEATLEEMVRFIRSWRPDIILSRFQGTDTDGHGHHQAAGILAREAFRAAADPSVFPGQFSHGLHVWKPKKLYVSGVGSELPPGGFSPGNPAMWTVRVPVGDYDPVLGRSYREIGSEGYSKHRTQGNGTAVSMPGPANEYFKLVESSVGIKAMEDNFFDSIDPSLAAIYDLAGNEKEEVPFLRNDLKIVQQCAAEALSAFQVTHPEKSAPAAARGGRLLNELIAKVNGSSISMPARAIVTDALTEKLRDFQQAVNAVLGIRLIARTGNTTAVPGEKEPINLYLYNQGPDAVAISRVAVSARENKGKAVYAADNPEGRQLKAGSAYVTSLSFDLTPKAGVTEPFWSLSTGNNARYAISPAQNQFEPFGQPELNAEVLYRFQEIEIPVYATGRAQAGDPLRGSDFEDFQIVPALSVALNPKIVIAPIGMDTKPSEFQVSVLNNQRNGIRGTLKLAIPAGWRVEPAEARFELSRKGETYTARFALRLPKEARPGNYTINAVATVGDREFRRGYHMISYPENWTRYFHFPAQAAVERFDIKIAPNLTVGYIPGAGDEVPGALEQLGIKVQVLSASDLAFGDLRRFPAIVTGIRAYNVNEDLRASNRRLLDYVAEGGTLIVQYVRPERPARGSTGPSFPYGPYAMNLSDADRITVEDSPVKMLDPANPVFNRPNKITQADFQGWVQERGLYFMNKWEPQYKALLSGNDPGEEPKNGGMLYAKYGKGHYIYTGYAWFRQLPAGVPGAYRIFANLLSLGQK